MNVVIVSGDVTLCRHNTTTSGKKVTNIGIKVEREGVKDGVPRTFLDGYFDVVRWGGAEVQEGDVVLVQGRLSGKKHWKQDAEGKDIWTVEIDATFGEIKVLGPGGVPASSGPAGSVPPDDDVPF